MGWARGDVRFGELRLGGELMGWGWEGALEWECEMVLEVELVRKRRKMEGGDSEE